MNRKPKYFIYSETQLEVIRDYEPNKEVNQVFINGLFVPYTEINSTGKSNFADAEQLGIHPGSWIKSKGVIQDSDLVEFIGKQLNNH